MRRKELTDYPFNKEALKEVIRWVKSDRSQADFCEWCGLPYSYMNRYAKAKNEDVLTINTIKKIAVATKTVAYEELLGATGYDA